MARASADKSIPPPLRALGGWVDAEWFDRSVLDGREVVSITLPQLPGSRKQSFELADRSVRQVGPKKATKPKPAAMPDKVPRGIGEVLDDVGMIRAAAFRRPRFFFEAAPTLFFADIPLANLKARAADRLRRNLIENAYRGCVLACGLEGVAGMFWPNQDAELTAFIRAASPPHALHPQFDAMEAQRRAAAPRSGRREAPEQRAERERLLAELDGLRAKVVELERQQSVLGAMEALGLDDARLKAMLLLLHPDKHGNSEAANEAAKWVNGLREALRSSKRS